MSSLIALIPARAGSKRIPNKNVRSFFGHPMLAYTVAAALNSRLFQRVIVSTDEPLIGRVAEWYGAEYLHRPAELARDDTSLVDVGLHALETLESQDMKADALCQLMPNCPLRRSADILNHYNLFESNRRCFQISVVSYRSVYPHWALVADDARKGHWVFGSQYLVNSQQLDRVYCPTGAIWWVRVADFILQRAFYGDPFHLAVMDANRGVDIDHPEDLAYAEILTLGLQQRDRESPLEPIDKERFPEESLE
jgi:CMP-N-acetylneuraminic acid synthetase